MRDRWYLWPEAAETTNGSRRGRWVAKRRIHMQQTVPNEQRAIDRELRRFFLSIERGLARTFRAVD